MELPAPADLLPLLALRAMVVGAMGRGKTTLVTALAEASRRPVVSGDPGQPAFGPPAAVARAHRAGRAWFVERVEALATFDVARFRLPLTMAVRRLAEAPGPLLVDTPGIVRGVAAGETLAALAEAAGVGTIVVLARGDELEDLLPALEATGAQLLRFAAPAAAWEATAAERAHRRTLRWESWLRDAVKTRVPLAAVRVVGIPPEDPSTWPGRAVAVLNAGGHTLALGEAAGLDGGDLALRAPPFDVGAARTLVVRDVRRDAEGHLRTLKAAPPPAAPPRPLFTPPRRAQAPLEIGAPRLRKGGVQASLVGGLFDDPFLLLRLINEPRCLLFDLGDPGRLPTRLAHLVTDVFVTHAHMDHFSGFLWLLRCRVGVAAPCRLYGPPGLAARASAFVRAFTWDRIGDGGPRFEVAELHGETLVRVDVQAGLDDVPRPDEPAADGVLRAEPGFRVRAATLDHGGTPVLAFVFEEPRDLRVRGDRLRARGLPPGPWLGGLKRLLHEGRFDAPVTLPDGTVESAGALGADLVLEERGRRIAYATDFADVPNNRRRLAALAHEADVLVCEASFAEAEAAQAERTGHLTARACGEIAAEADVAELVPFHLSRRYEDRPADVYAEVLAAFPRARVPEGVG